jgi:predicted nucleotidyltransferase
MIKDLTGTEREVLEYFAVNPAEIHVRGLADEMDLPYSSVRNSLESLGEKGFLGRDEKAKMTFYRPEGEDFREAKKLINLERILDAELIQDLEERLRPEAIVLFGSYLEGRDDQDSDIDLAVIGGRQKELDLDDFEEKLGREIQITRIESLTEESSEFRNTLANGLVLRGYLQVV